MPYRIMPVNLCLCSLTDGVLVEFDTEPWASQTVYVAVRKVERIEIPKQARC